jgi:preprotein translocase subunit YajC
VSGFLLIIAIGALFIWLAFVRPQKRQQQQQHAMWESLELGDEVVTAGGIYGEITEFEGDDLVVRIAPEVEVRIARRAIGGVVSRATDDAEDAEEEAGETDPGESDLTHSDSGAETSAPGAESYSEEPR